MPTPNYGYEKRQKELAKRRKKEDKLKARADRKTGMPGEADGEADGEVNAEAGLAPGETAAESGATQTGAGRSPV